MLFPIRSILSRLPRIKIVDVGAMAVGQDPYQRLVEAVACEIVGFEPNEVECERLNAGAGARRAYLPYVVGDGAAGTFYQCAAPMCSSLLEPNAALAAKFSGLSEMLSVVDASPVTTRRLDDIPEARGADLLKLDVQGAELMVLEGGTTLLQDLLVLHTEAEFVPLYRNQPVFSDIDRWLRNRGFVLHKIVGVASRPFHPMMSVVPEGDPLLSQLLWCDVVYVRDFMQLERLSPDQLAKLAAIMHENYGSYDFVAAVLKALDRSTGAHLHSRYLESFHVM